MVEHASNRAALNARTDLGHGLASLATIASAASLLGLLGTTVQMITHMLYSCGGSWSSCNYPVFGRASEALTLCAFGLLVSLLSFSIYRYLGNELATLDLEMNNAQLDLLNKLALLTPLPSPAKRKT